MVAPWSSFVNMPDRRFPTLWCVARPEGGHDEPVAALGRHDEAQNGRKPDKRCQRCPGLRILADTSYRHRCPAADVAVSDPLRRCAGGQDLRGHFPAVLVAEGRVMGKLQRSIMLVVGHTALRTPTVARIRLDHR